MAGSQYNVTSSGELVVTGSGDDVIYNVSVGFGYSVINPRDSVTIDTGFGDDQITNGGNYSSLVGGDGSDNIINQGSYSSIFGGAGNDFIENSFDVVTDALLPYTVPGGDHVFIDGGSDDDYITNVGSYVTIDAGTGNDTITNNGAYVTIDGHTDNNDIYNSGSYVSINAGSGDDTITNAGHSGSFDFGSYIAYGSYLYGSYLGSDYLENLGSFYLENLGSSYSGFGSALFGEYVTINAGSGSDYIYNSGSNVIIDAGDGNDTIYLESGSNVSISMGSGSDLLIYSLGTDIVQDFTSEDSISIGSFTISESVTSGDDVIISFSDSDIITLQNTDLNDLSVQDGMIIYGDSSETGSGSRSDTTSGSLNLDGNDTIYADGSRITIYSENSGTSIYAYGSNNTIDAGAGSDIVEIVSSEGSGLYIVGGDGNDSIMNGSLNLQGGLGEPDRQGMSSITIDAGDGDDSIANYYGNYLSINADSGNNYITSYYGDFITINTGNGDDEIHTHKESDFTLINSGSGNDYIEQYAGGSYATINAGDGDDEIIIHLGDFDLIDAGAGNDTIESYDGNDVSISMGSGSDLFYFFWSGSNLIYDFTPEDQISIGSHTIESSIQSGSDVIILFGSAGNITLQNTVLESLSVHDSLITYGSGIDLGSGSDTTSGSFNLNGNDTIYADDTNITIETTDFGSSIYAYNSNDIIDAGSGSDVISLNNSRSDLIQYTADNDSIYGFGSGDSISISSESGYEYFNGHFYKFYHDGMTWSDASNFANSLGGYLVAITSAEEQSAVQTWLENYGSKNSYWMGGSMDSTGSWQWVTGEEFGYTHWGSLQPDGDGSSAMIYYGSNFYSTLGQWNDFPESGSNHETFFGLENFGFIVEWNSVPAGVNQITGSLQQIGSDVVIELNGDSDQFLTIKDTDIENVSIIGSNLITYISETGSGSDTTSGSGSSTISGSGVVSIPVYPEDTIVGIDVAEKIFDAVGSFAYQGDDPRFHVYEENGQIYLSTVRSSQALGKVIVKGSSVVFDTNSEIENRIMTFKAGSFIQSWEISLGTGDDQLNISAGGKYNGGSSADYFHITDSLDSNVTITGGTGSSGNIFYAKADTVSNTSEQNIITVTDANFNNGDVLLIDAGIENLTKDFFDQGKFFNYANADQASNGIAKNVFDASELIYDQGMDFSMVKMANRSDVNLSSKHSVRNPINVVWVNDSKTIIDLDQTDKVLLFADTNDDVGDFVALSGNYNDTIHVGNNDTIDSGGGNDLLIGWNSSNMLILDKFNSAQLDDGDLIIDGSVTITNIDLSTDVFANVDGVEINIMDSVNNIDVETVSLVATDS